MLRVGQFQTDMQMVSSSTLAARFHLGALQKLCAALKDMTRGETNIYIMTKIAHDQLSPGA